ncbi:MAG: DegT/DnrJ/EryC1/StrS family aminotransferase [Negativicutes bacterium]|nr:DegT/DnrJ/EryC1/StrS family aminotransferase [Negativicutes bacterium]
MPKRFRGFPSPVYVTRPLLPSLDKVQAELQEIWGSKWLTNNGLQHNKLEGKLTEFLQVPFLSLFNNGTTALLTACQGLGLTGEVITTPFTFAATPHVLSWQKLRPVFCDIDSETLNINPAMIEALITPETSAIMPVHVFGMPCDVKTIQAIADYYNLKVIYDAAHAFGVRIDGVGIGNFGDASMFSFHATKLFHTVEGGALTCPKESLKVQLDLLKNFGIQSEDEVLFPGINGKMNEIQAAVGLLVLELLAEAWAKRSGLIQAYRECLNDMEGITYCKPAENVEYNHQYFVIRINEQRFGCSRDHVYQQLKEYNVFARKYFYPLCSNYSCYSALPSASPDRLPVAGQVADEVLSLPLHGELAREDIVIICDIIRSQSRAKLIINA